MFLHQWHMVDIKMKKYYGEMVKAAWWENAKEFPIIADSDTSFRPSHIIGVQ